MRGVAILLVFLHHYGTALPITWWGWTGVDLFFVLSGFLITGILYDTVHRPDFFKTFYIRRSLRIFPLYFAYWLVVWIVVRLLHVKFEPRLLAWVVYLGNYTTLLATSHGLSFGVYTNIGFYLPHQTIHRQFIFGHFWSLCVEEQYYMVWPIVVFWIRDRKRLIQACIAGIVLTLLLRLLLENSLSPAILASDFIFKCTVARADSLLAGGLIALIARGQKGITKAFAGSVYVAGGVALFLLVFSAHVHGTTRLQSVVQPWLIIYGLTLTAAISCGVLMLALRVVPVQRILTFRPLLALGKVSYGFYILHYLALGILLVPGTLSPLGATLLKTVYFCGTWLVSWVSFRFYEQWFLRLKEILAPSMSRGLTNRPTLLQVQKRGFVKAKAEPRESKGWHQGEQANQ